MKKLFLTYTLLVGAILLTSCNKKELIEDENLSYDFLSSVETNLDDLMSIQVIGADEMEKMSNHPSAKSSMFGSEIITITPAQGASSYTLTQINSVRSIRDISALNNNDEVTIDFGSATASNSNVSVFHVPNRDVISNMQRMIMEAKRYLYAQSFTDQDIQRMLMEAGATEDDLVTLVTYLSNSTRPGLTWEITLNCLSAAVGIEALETAVRQAAGGKLTFRAAVSVLKTTSRRLMPAIGVAITVYSFISCIDSTIKNVR